MHRLPRPLTATVELGHAQQPLPAARHNDVQQEVVGKCVQCCCRVLLVGALSSVNSLAALLHVLLLLEFDSALSIVLCVNLLVVGAQLLLDSASVMSPWPTLALRRQSARAPPGQF